jgi:hypothetical protein
MIATAKRGSKNVFIIVLEKLDNASPHLFKPNGNGEIQEPARAGSGLQLHGDAARRGRLPHRFEQNNACRGGEIQAPRPTHGNREQIVTVCGQQAFRQAFGLSPKDQKIAGEKPDIIISALRFGCKKEEARRCLARSSQLLEGIPELNVDFFPIIKASPF